QQLCPSSGASNCASVDGSCSVEPYVCPDGSCGPNNQECSRTVYTAQKQYSKCMDFPSSNATCTNCDVYWCASFQMYTGYDAPTNTCQNPKCTNVPGYTNACVPPSPPPPLDGGGGK